MTGFGTPSRHSLAEDVRASEAVAAAQQERARLGRDGPAPSTESILREMGRGPDGYPIDEGPDEWVPASTAGGRALGLEEAIDWTTTEQSETGGN